MGQALDPADRDAMRLAGFAARHPKEAAMLPLLDGRELITVASGIRSLRHALFDVHNLPSTGDGIFKAWIDDEVDRLAEIEELAIREVERRTPDGADWSEERIRLIATYDLEECGADIGETIAKMQTMLAAHEGAVR